MPTLPRTSSAHARLTVSHFPAATSARYHLLIGPGNSVTPNFPIMVMNLAIVNMASDDNDKTNS